jgi:hypothetical protein
MPVVSFLVFYKMSNFIGSYNHDFSNPDTFFQTIMLMPPTACLWPSKKLKKRFFDNVNGPSFKIEEKVFPYLTKILALVLRILVLITS